VSAALQRRRCRKASSSRGPGADIDRRRARAARVDRRRLADPRLRVRDNGPCRADERRQLLTPVASSDAYIRDDQPPSASFRAPRPDLSDFALAGRRLPVGGDGLDHRARRKADGQTLRGVQGEGDNDPKLRPTGRSIVGPDIGAWLVGNVFLIALINVQGLTTVYDDLGAFRPWTRLRLGPLHLS